MKGRGVSHPAPSPYRRVRAHHHESPDLTVHDTCGCNPEAAHTTQLDHRPPEGHTVDPYSKRILAIGLGLILVGIVLGMVTTGQLG